MREQTNSQSWIATQQRPQQRRGGVGEIRHSGNRIWAAELFQPRVELPPALSPLASSSRRRIRDTAASSVETASPRRASKRERAKETIKNAVTRADKKSIDMSMLTWREARAPDDEDSWFGDLHQRRRSDASALDAMPNSDEEVPVDDCGNGLLTLRALTASDDDAVLLNFTARPRTASSERRRAFFGMESISEDVVR